VTRPDWLIKDFHVLYRASQEVHEAFVAALEGVAEPGRIERAHQALATELDRLAPAFEVCEENREWSGERLANAERKALNALHRWLHSPAGDDALVEDAQDYHDRLAVGAPEECARLDVEEREAWARLARYGAEQASEEETVEVPPEGAQP
jgi:hypothetical protein